LTISAGISLNVFVNPLSAVLLPTLEGSFRIALMTAELDAIDLIVLR